MTTHVITDIPNDFRNAEAIQRLRSPGTHVRLRGRGHRFGVRKYHQDLPRGLASHLTVYAAPAAKVGDYWRKTRWQYVSTDMSEDGPKLRVRLVSGPETFSETINRVRGES